MARKTFDIVDICEILMHWHAGRSKNEIAGVLGLSRNTVRKYLAPAEAAGLTSGGPAVRRERWGELARQWFPELADAQLRQKTRPAIAEHHDFITAQRAAGIPVSVIHQRLSDERGLAVSVASVRRYVAASLPGPDRAARPGRGARPAAGREAWVQLGRLGRWPDPLARRPRTVWAFAMVLARSRHLFLRPVLALNPQSWAQCHVAAFEFFGGVPASILLVSARTAARRPDLHDPRLNRGYAELAAHYGFTISPAGRAGRRHADVLPYLREAFWPGREFASLDGMQAAAAQWSAAAAGRRACPELSGAAPAAVFEAVERARLAPLPAGPPALARWTRVAAGTDQHARVGASLYSVPWQYAGQLLDARSDGATVQFFAGAELIRTHVRKARGRQTDLADYPPELTAFHLRSPAWCRAAAARVGPACAALVGSLLDGSAPGGLPAAQGVLDLADRQQPGLLESACAAAADPSVATVAALLAAGLAGAPARGAAPRGGNGRGAAARGGPSAGRGGAGRRPDDPGGRQRPRRTRASPRAQAPDTAVTPLRVPTSMRLPAGVGETKCGSDWPRLSRWRALPVAGSSSYRTPAFQSATQTAPPPTTGEPLAAGGPRHSTRIRLPAVLTAARPPG